MIFLRRFAVILCAFFLCSPAFISSARAQEGPVMLTPGAAPPADDDYRNFELEKSLDAAFATGDFVGLAVAVVRKGETRFIKTWGEIEAGGATKVTPSTVFRVGSLSKGFASTLAGLAMTQGLLSPEDPATRFAPGLKLTGGAETSLQLGHLLSHQTGLPPNAYDNLLEAGTPIADIYAKYAKVKLICPVGKCYSYQNIAYDIAGLAVSSAYGESYADAVRTKIFAPLGMTTASVGEDGLLNSTLYARPNVRERVKGATDEYTPWRAVDVKPNYYRVPAAGGVNASLIDMTLWLKAQMGRAPETLSPALLDLVHAPRVISPAETARMRRVSPRFHAAQYAFGWRLYNYEGAPVIAHAGTVEGYAAHIAWLPEEDAGIVILSNSASKRFWRILPTFLDLELALPREDWLALSAAGTGASPTR
ncbi:MAG: serine hydrolase domain-containing protein [Parvularculaceae bacterium]